MAYALHLLAKAEWQLPVLKGLIEAPTLRRDGSLLDKPGYDPKSGLLYDPGDAEFPPFPEKMTKEAARTHCRLGECDRFSLVLRA